MTTTKAPPAEASGVVDIAAELDARLLAEARSRDHGRRLRRFLILAAAGFVFLAAGVQYGEALGVVGGLVFLAVAAASR